MSAGAVAAATAIGIAVTRSRRGKGGVVVLALLFVAFLVFLGFVGVTVWIVVG